MLKTIKEFFIIKKKEKEFDSLFELRKLKGEKNGDFLLKFLNCKLLNIYIYYINNEIQAPFSLADTLKELRAEGESESYIKKYEKYAKVNYLGQCKF